MRVGSEACSGSSCIVFSHFLSGTWNVPSRLGWPAREFEVHLFEPPIIAITGASLGHRCLGACQHTRLRMGGDPNSGPHTYIVNSLPTELSPLPCCYLKHFFFLI